MSSVLIVDDNSRKVALISDVLARVDASISVDVAHSSVAAAEKMTTRAYDLVVLDLVLPIRDNEEPRADGGKRLLGEIARRRALRQPAYLVGLTAYPDIAEDQRDLFERECWLIVAFDESSTAWELPIQRKAEQIVDLEKGRNPLFDYDLAIVTALVDVELEMVLKLDASWVLLKRPGDPSIYYEGWFKRGDKRLKVVAAAAAEMGMAAAAALSMKMTLLFRPVTIAMTGIAAGVRGKFGDVLVAEHAWDYGSGKKRRQGRKSIFLPSPTQVAIDTCLRNALADFKMHHGKEVCSKIRSAWTGSTPPAPLSIRIGPLASGAAVLEDRQVIRQLARQQRKIIGVEMEVYGVYVATKLAPDPRPRCVGIKSICDFASIRKSDTYQAYAAFTSAQTLFEFALRCL